MNNFIIFRVYESEDDYDCNCIQPCQSRIYTTFIQSRKTWNQPEPRSLIYIYYTTKLISVGIQYITTKID